ncbi:hypothetical protein D9623_14400 [Azospirillum brasilense]|uniref:Uncharacterized protein n=1 Tax=Azospirillum brasilense TaxID=192 RepID=A0A0P0ES56_AZOBR|nr:MULTISPECIES: hypothetical protein [Azospirillum]ALJ37280.1 hypothetical protein AMK58_17535 [Azospirillum brasilense]MDW7552005.1 hypothetical protein [Azospirillum brasilense]MDW7591440.1 hypothetical protein [Azospirillum brasilense]MDW7626610.1 hypothetical protein [Azospirillum brasilense]MDX5951041.1 hypothetical protein [Azospirillum brasilense]
MQTANINDPLSIESVYPRSAFDNDARQNARDKEAVEHGVMILSMPDADGNFALKPSQRHVGEPETTTHSIFLSPTLENSEYGALNPSGSGYDGPIEPAESVKTSSDPYRSFVDSLIQAARDADFPPSPPAESLKGFRGG